MLTPKETLALNKKGQTLVEVLVALGIIATVFAGTVTLIVRVVGLEISARDRTEAIAYSQKVLNQAVAELKTGCTSVRDVTDPNNIPAPPPRFQDPEATVSCQNVNAAFANIGDCTDAAQGLLLVTTSFSWSSRDTGPETYTISQVVRKEQ